MTATSTGGSTAAGGDTGIGGAAPQGKGGAASTGGGSGTGGSAGGVSTGGGGAGNLPACSGPILMSDPCAHDGQACVLPGAPCDVIWTCTKARWRMSYKSDGFCNPPPPCPDIEPVAGTVCPSTLVSLNVSKGCRYSNGACFTYWDCRPATSTEMSMWESAKPGAADGCCPVASPAAGVSCTAADAQCTYVDEIATCGSAGWSVAPPLPQPGGAGGAGSAGTSGNGGAGG